MKTLECVSVVLLIFAAGIGARVNCQSRAPQFQPPAGWWNPVVPPDKSFTVEMPDQVEHTHDPVTSDEPFVGEGYRAWEATTGLHFYSIEILCANELHRPSFTPDTYFKAVWGERRVGRQGSIKQISIDGFPGREVISTKSDSTFFIRWVVVGPRIYVLSLISGDDKDAARWAKRFFDSFHVSRANGPLPGCPGNEGRFPTATAGKIRLVVFPNYWMSNKKGEENTLIDAQWLEIRSRRTSLAEEWLFGALDYYDSRSATPDPEWYAKNFYAVRVSDHVMVSDLSRAEWNRAKVISTQATEVFWGDDSKPTLFEYRGHKYSKTSEHWGTVSVSPGGRWVAIYSYSGENAPVFLWSGGLPREGDMFWDVYDSTSGEKVLSWTAKSVRNPGLLGQGTIWVEDRYLVMPFDSILKGCVIGILRSE
jgi:hypothetical protein